jgi:hypothetical protein
VEPWGDYYPRLVSTCKCLQAFAEDFHFLICAAMPRNARASFAKGSRCAVDCAMPCMPKCVKSMS